jgi:hypothetical protein
MFGWIRIQKAKMTHKNSKKCKNFMFLSAGCSLWRTERLFCSLIIFPGGLGINELYFLIIKKISEPGSGFALKPMRIHNTWPHN